MLLVLLAALAFLAHVQTAPAAASTMYTVTGRGYGHGVGMSQYGAYGYAKHGLGFRQILVHYFTDTTVAPIGSLTVRVLIADGASQVSAASSTRLSLYDEHTGSRKSLAAGNVFSVTLRSGTYRVTNATQGTVVGDFTGPIRLTPSGVTIKLLGANSNGQSRVTYRGFFRLLIRNGRLRVVNFVPVESYLRGVVPREMPASWHVEALKCQAIAARSYAVAKKKSGGDFDLYSTVQSQYYGGVPAEDARTNTAIAVTKNLVVKYASKVVAAYFHSTSGGQTENIENVWGGSALAWARGVSDPYDTISPYHSWPNNPIRMTPSALAAKLSGYLKGTLRGLVVTSTGASPRVRWLTVYGSKGSSYMRGATLRDRLHLRSTWFGVRGMSIASTTTIVRYGRSLAVTGASRPVPPGRKLTFKARRIGVAKWSTATIDTAADGHFYKTVKPSAGTYYQAAVGWATSPTILIRVRAAVSLAASTGTLKLGQTVRLTGAVAPGHPGKTVNVKYYAADGWRTFASPKLNTYSRYSVAFRPGKKGTFYFSTLFPSDFDHVGNVSGVRTLVVK